MSGHSKWKTIKYAKGAKDAKRASDFTKISKEISTAAQLGGGADPLFNYLLRVPIEKARAANMTNERIEHAIKRGLGLLKDEKIMHNNTYEAYAPDGTALLIDSTTDNPTRTIAELKTIVQKNGGKLLNEGSISWKFKEIGRIIFEIPHNLSSDEVELMLIESVPLDDMEIVEEDNKKKVYVIVKKEKLKEATNEIIKTFGEVKFEETGIAKIPNDYTHEYNDELQSFIEKIEDYDDVDNVWTDAN